MSRLETSSDLRRFAAAVVAACVWFFLGGILAWGGYSDGVARHAAWFFASPFAVASRIAPEPAVLPVAFGITVATFFVASSLAATVRRRD